MAFRIIGLSVISAIMLTACQTGGPRDTSGKPVQYDTWKQLSIYDTELNFAEFIPVKITESEWRMRDNELINERFKLEGNKGILYEERILSQSVFTDRVESSLRDPESIRKIFSQYGNINVKSVAGNAIGYYGISNSPKCLFAFVGYKFNGQAVYTASPDNVDTIIRFRYCDPNVTYQQFSEFFESMRLVENKNAYKAILKSKNSSHGKN